MAGRSGHLLKTCEGGGVIVLPHSLSELGSDSGVGVRLRILFLGGVGSSSGFGVVGCLQVCILGGAGVLFISGILSVSGPGYIDQ